MAESAAETGAPGLSPSAAEAEPTKRVDEEDEEDEDEDALLTTDIFGGGAALAETKKGPSHADPRRANQKALDSLFQGKPLIEKAKPKPAPAPALAAEEPTTTQDGRSSLGSLSAPSSPPPSFSKAKKGRGGGRGEEEGEEEEEEEEEEGESEPDEFNPGYMAQPVKELRLLQWWQQKAGLWVPSRELTTQEASLVNTGGDNEPLREDQAWVDFFPTSNTSHVTRMKVTRDKLKPFDWDPLAALAHAAPPDSESAAKPAAAAADPGEEKEGKGEEEGSEEEERLAKATWTPSLLTLSGQEEVVAQLSGRSKAGAGAGAGAKGKKRKKAKTGWNTKKKSYTAKQWDCMMRFAQQTLAESIAALQAERRESLLCMEADAAQLLAEKEAEGERGEEEEEEEEEDKAAAAAEGPASLLATGRGDNRGTVTLSVGDKIEYIDRVSKAPVVAVIVRIHKKADEDEFPLKLDNMEILDWDAVVTKVANYKPGANTKEKKWADVAVRKVKAVRDHVITKAGEADAALMELLGGTKGSKVKAMMEAAATDIQAYAEKINKGEVDSEEESGSSSSSSSEESGEDEGGGRRGRRRPMGNNKMQAIAIPARKTKERRVASPSPVKPPQKAVPSPSSSSPSPKRPSAPSPSPSPKKQQRESPPPPPPVEQEKDDDQSFMEEDTDEDEGEEAGAPAAAAATPAAATGAADAATAAGAGAVVSQAAEAEEQEKGKGGVEAWVSRSPRRRNCFD